MSPPVAGSGFGTGVAGEEQRTMPGPDQQARTNTESALGTSKTNVAFGRIAAQVSIAVNPLGEREGVQRPLTGPVTEKTGMVTKAIV
jgi:hypothetical protein